MKYFYELRNKKPPGEQVFTSKVKGIQVDVHKDKGKFVTYVDGDKLDVYRTDKEAIKAGEQFVKQFKGIK